MDLVEFPKFPELPGEIRQETFTFCLPQRTLGVYDCRTKIRLRGYMLIIAQVCKEAQAVAATAVQSDPASLFCPKDTWYSWSRSDTASMAPLLFNVQNDILWVGWEFMVLRRPLGITVAVSAECLVDALVIFYDAKVNDRMQGSAFYDFILHCKHCMVTLNETSYHTKHLDDILIPCGMFDDEGVAFIDVLATEKVDIYYQLLEPELGKPAEEELGRWEMQSRSDEHGFCRRGLQNYSSDAGPNWSGYYPSPVQSDGVSNARHDSALTLHCIKEMWLKANGCFERQSPNFIPCEKHESFNQCIAWDENNPTAKTLLAKLADFSFVTKVRIDNDRPTYNNEAYYSEDDWNSDSGGGNTDRTQTAMMKTGSHVHTATRMTAGRNIEELEGGIEDLDGNSDDEVSDR